jgi:hypothetical protein
MLSVTDQTVSKLFLDNAQRIVKAVVEGERQASTLLREWCGQPFAFAGTQCPTCRRAGVGSNRCLSSSVFAQARRDSVRWRITCSLMSVLG